MELEEDIFEGVEGLSGDEKAIDPQNNETEKLRVELEDLRKQIKDANLPGYSSVRSQRDTMVDRFSKMVSFIEKSGVGKWDPATGEIIQIEPEAKDTTNDQVSSIDKQIRETKAHLREKLNDGRITEEEYEEQLDIQIEPLRDRKLELIADKKAKELIKPTSGKQTAENVVDNSITSIAAEFSEIDSQYPETADPNSDLFKKMAQIYESNPKTWSLANYGELGPDGRVVKYTGNPGIRKMLIENAVNALKLEGKWKEDQRKQTVKNFHTHASQPAASTSVAEKHSMSSEQVRGLVSQGIGDKTLLKDINKNYASYMSTGVLSLEG